ncbi:PAC2 family protein [Arthrobacter sp. JZ12]|uniref:proteasome assembly chaperone family protein n=1 Tax=Arthrobacter sp. JZ12 TaxID=2654190 RepID=UPI002B478808|nr:PAC2 family protein [Arthrobacter sp. JZ12]WRH24760.1 PAC2 family protein [Arthrobacter sp. JZ12]
MLEPRTLYNLNNSIIDDPALQGLPLVAGFTGFVDAGQVVSQVREELLDSLENEVLAVFDTDQLIDYRSRRPRITFDQDHLTDYQPPALELRVLQDRLGERFLLLSGMEPDLQWERFAAAVRQLVTRLDTPLVSWIHSIPMPVPHTRPIGVTVHGNRSDLIEGMGSSWKPTAELQASMGHLLELRLTQEGHDVVGYVVHVPHYLAEAEYPPAAVAALEYLGASIGRVLPTDRLREAGRDVERQIARQVDNSAEVRGVVSSLEKRYDEHADGSRRSLLVKQNMELAGADEIGAAVEAYLAGPRAAEELEQALNAPTDPERLYENIDDAFHEDAGDSSADDSATDGNRKPGD